MIVSIVMAGWLLAEMPALPNSFEQRLQDQQRVEQTERWLDGVERRAWQEEDAQHRAQLRDQLDRIERERDDDD
jgi:hypothetical protein